MDGTYPAGRRGDVLGRASVEEAALAFGTHAKQPAHPLPLDSPPGGLSSEIHMTMHRKHDMIPQPHLPLSRRLLLIPALAAALWLFLQKGCAQTPDISPAGIRIDVEVPAVPAGGVGAGRMDPVAYCAPLADEHSTSSSQKPKNRSLQHASDLLRKAAVLLDKNDRSAIRLILQAIAILHHEIMREADAPEYDRVSVQPPAPHGGAITQESPAILCRPEESSSRDPHIAPTLIAETIDPLHGRFISAHAGWTTECME